MTERVHGLRAALFGVAPPAATRSRGDRTQLQPSGAAPTKTLYFAYGSNLQLAQMAQRCPSSKFVGRGVLDDFRWQISTRGYANVVAEPGSRVEGLIFILGDDDERRLDRSEGVSKGSYRKEYLPVRFYLAAKPLYLRSVPSIVRAGGPRTVLEDARRQGKDLSVLGPIEEDRVLVYLNLEKIHDGPPLTEYIDRINLGIQDATALGMRHEFVQKVIRRYVPANPPVRSNVERGEQGAAPAPPTTTSPKRKTPTEQSPEPRTLRRAVVEPERQGMITRLGSERPHGQSGPSRRRSRRGSQSRPLLERFINKLS